MSPKMAAWLQSEDWPSLGYYRETYPETALTNRKRAQKREEIKQTLIPGKRKESLARSENRGTSTERRTLSSIQVYAEAMLIHAGNLIGNKRPHLGLIRPTVSFCLKHKIGRAHV